MPRYLTEEEKAYRRAWRSNCGVCGVEMGIGKAGKPRTYCSWTCSGKAVGKVERNFGKLRTEECRWCGNKIVSYYNNRKFCSRYCFGMSYRGAKKHWHTNGRKDANQQSIVETIEKAGARVLDMSHIGNGFPDLLVGCRGVWYLLEVKNPKTSYGRKGLNKMQREFHEEWSEGPVFVVKTEEEALIALGLIDADEETRAKLKLVSEEIR